MASFFEVCDTNTVVLADIPPRISCHGAELPLSRALVQRACIGSQAPISVKHSCLCGPCRNPLLHQCTHEILKQSKSHAHILTRCRTLGQESTGEGRLISSYAYRNDVGSVYFAAGQPVDLALFRSTNPSNPSIHSTSTFAPSAIIMSAVEAVLGSVASRSHTRSA